MYFDNFVVHTLNPTLAAGTTIVDAMAVTLNCDGQSNLDMLEWLCNQRDLEYVIHPKAGWYNDTIDVDSDVGRDLSDVVVFEEGVNISALQVNRTAEGIATLLNMQGQASDDDNTGFVCMDLDGFDDWGVIEDYCNDSRIDDVTTAKTIGDYELARRAAGNVSLSGYVEDESLLAAQTPIWGYAKLGDFIWGGREQVHAGDYVRLISKRRHINEKARVVEAGRKDGDKGAQFVFDCHAYRKSQELPKLRAQIERDHLRKMKRNDTQSFRLDLSGTTPQTFSLKLWGTYEKVYIDVTSPDWQTDHAVTVTIDGVNRTAAIFGTATIVTNQHRVDTTYLVLSGDHTVTITPTVDSVVVVVQIRPNMLG